MTTHPHTLRSATLAVSQEMLAPYGALTRDSNPLHTDGHFAASTPYGRCIAHGTLSLNALWRSIEASFPPEVAAHVEIDVRFTAPVFPGETLTGGGARRLDGTWEVWVTAGERTVVSGTLVMP
jgi:3-hydroxybutyryl-CoA dehydratase